MNSQCLEVARQSIKDFLNKKEKGFIPDVDFVARLLKSKEFELSELGCQLSEEEIQKLSKEINSEETITIRKASTIMSKEKEPWLHTLNNPSTYYSNRYKNYLNTDEGFSRQVVDKIFQTTDEILDFMTNPNIDTECIKKGLVMGNVQSGKTANYLALINKAADVGYKLIILITGVHENLRKQTQARVNSGFIGFDRIKSEYMGVDKRGEGREKQPFSFTTTESDFNKNLASSLGFNPANSKVPVILVIKKNSSILKSLLEWLETNKSKNAYATYPLLLIDDEADNASINTKKHPNETTTINRQIRLILNMFQKRSYVGYTATPFANIFINPNSKKDDYGDDLFPEDFIVSLESPENYIGAQKIFNTKNNTLIAIDDNELCLDERLKKDDSVDCLPDSLKEAIIVYLLSIGIRRIRKNRNLHSSMLINVSFRIQIQEQVKELVYEYVEKIKNRIKYNCKKPFQEMINDKEMKIIYRVWEKEYSNKNAKFIDVLQEVNIQREFIKIFLVNSKKTNDEKLNYENYKDIGLNAITIGGYSLSRGFTIEGLTVSYFLRNSQMYDTLLQMGRWFGYRNGYEDLCRIYMKEKAIGWYQHISEATEELKEEFKIMNDHNLTPRDYGLKVKNHDESLIITARNKMIYSNDVTISINYYGELVETRKIPNDDTKINNNLNTLKNFIQNMPNSNRDKEENKNFLWRNIDVSSILSFIKSYNNHPLNIKTDAHTIEKYLIEQNITKFDVALISNKNKDSGFEQLSNDIIVYKEMRSSFIERSYLQISGNKSRVGSISDEKIGLDNIEDLQKSLNGKSASGADYRKIRKVPLLILHILKIQKKDDTGNFPKNLEAVVAYGISFPGEANGRRKANAVTYSANKSWFENNNINNEEEDDEE